MTHSELAELILEWAKSRKEPFMTAEAFNAVEAAENANETSQAIALLYRKGLLARKKVDGVRFSYSLPEIAPEGYEAMQPIGLAKALINEMQSEHEVETKSPVIETKPAVMETEQPVGEATARKVETKHKKTESQDVRANNHFPLQAQIGQVEIPDNFVLSLRSPGGFVITITAPGAK